MTDIDVPMERIRALAHRAATEAVAIDQERDLGTMRMREIMADLSETTTEMYHAMDGHYPKTLVCSMSKELTEAVEQAARNASLRQNRWIERACLARLNGDIHRRTGSMQPRVFRCTRTDFESQTISHRPCGRSGPLGPLTLHRPVPTHPKVSWTFPHLHAPSPANSRFCENQHRTSVPQVLPDSLQH